MPARHSRKIQTHPWYAGLIVSLDRKWIRNTKLALVRNTVPNIEEEMLPPYDYIVLVTKNCPDIPPTIADLIRPALSPNNTHTAVVLIQNGLNIEKPLFAEFPSTSVLSGVSLIGSAEPKPGFIVQEDRDKLLIGAFDHPNLPIEVGKEKAKEFVLIYGAGQKTEPVYRGEPGQVLHDRWRKLVYNAALNPICAILGLDSGRVRLADGVVDGLVRPAMNEIVAAAKARGVEEFEIDREAGRGANVREGEPPVVQYTIDVDPLELYMKPSMQADVDKVSRNPVTQNLRRLFGAPRLNWEENITDV